MPRTGAAAPAGSRGVSVESSCDPRYEGGMTFPGVLTAATRADLGAHLGPVSPRPR